MAETKKIKNLEKKDYIVIGVTALISGSLIGFIAYLYLGISTGILIGISSGVLIGIGVNLVRTTLLANVTYPKLKSLINLTLYTLIICCILAAFMVSLDLLFSELRNIIL